MIDERCEYCWCPRSFLDSREGCHNQGCPINDRGLMIEWRRGYRYGWNDNFIHHWRYRYYTPAFILGWQVGQADIDQLAEAALEDRQYRYT